MKDTAFIFLVSTILLCGCASPSRLPAADISGHLHAGPKLRITLADRDIQITEFWFGNGAMSKDQFALIDAIENRPFKRDIVYKDLNEALEEYEQLRPNILPQVILAVPAHLPYKKIALALESLALQGFSKVIFSCPQ